MLKVGQKIRYPDEEIADDYYFEGRIIDIQYSHRCGKSFYHVPVFHLDPRWGPDELYLWEDDKRIEIMDENMSMPFVEVAPRRLVDTKEMDKQTWLRWRRSGVTGTDVAAVFGMHPYKTAYQIYQDKNNLLPEVEDNNAMKLGRDMESIVAKWFSEATDFKLENRYAIYQHKYYEWMLANIDRWIVGEDAIFEAKTANFKNQSHLWGPTGSDMVPEYYLFQVYQYMIVFGVRKGYLGVIFNDTYDFRWYEFNLDEDFASTIIRRTYDFWYGNVMNQIEPPISNMNDLLIKYPNEQKGAVIASSRAKELCLEHEAIRQSINEMKRRQEQIKVAIGQEMGEFRELLIDKDGLALAGFTKPKPREYVNIAMLKEKYPDAANEACFTKESKRSLNVRWQTLQKAVNE